MSNQDHIFNEEKEYLNSTLNTVKESAEVLEESVAKLGSVNLNELKSLREDSESGLDLLIAIQKLHEKNEAFNLPDKYKRLEELKEAEKEPYFSRIDLLNTNNNELKTVYIGKFGIMGDKEPIVTDWRAKIASVYYRYRYPQQNVQYNTPEGVEKRDLKLKRTFEIDDGILIKYYNNDIQLDEDEIIADKIEQRTGGVLEDIVETIQEAQLDIIEADPRQICIVQGCVGSGKSTVAIHKLSHIFFNFPKIIKAERAILIAKNQILVSYLSTLFPKLGIFDINFKTIKDLIIRLSFVEEFGLHYDFDKKSDLSSFDINKINQLTLDLQKIHDKYAQRLEGLFEKEEFVYFAGFVYNPEISVEDNVVELIKDMNEEVGIQKDHLKETSNPVRKDLHKENIKTLRKIVREVRKIGSDVKSKDLKKLLKKYNIDTSKHLSYTQALVYSAIHLELFGLHKFNKFEYCVVDEGQDFTPLEYLVLGKLVLNGRFCILGDLNQSYDQGGLSKWEEISSVINEAAKAQVYELDTNYRSTKQIIDFACEILRPYTQEFLPKPINRMGPGPKVTNFSSEEELFGDLKTKIEEDIKNLDKSIGIICMDESLMPQAYKTVVETGLEKDKIVMLDPNQSIHYIPKGVYVTSAKECKGLEFGKAYVLGLDLESINNFTDAKRAFVTVTRAMNELEVLSIQS